MSGSGNSWGGPSGTASGTASAAAAPTRSRVGVFVAVALACVGAAGAYAWWTAQQRAAAPSSAAGTPARVERSLASLPAQPPYVLLRATGHGSSHGRLALEPMPGTADASSGTRGVSTVNCDRVHAAAGRVICLESRRGVVTSYHAHLLDGDLKTTASFDLAGAPSRTRMAADGTLAATTVFVSGHAYSAPGFSTRTSIIDVANARMLAGDLEAFTVVRDGQPFKAVDFNFWGVTFKPGSKGFYATLQTDGKQYLVEGDIAAQRMTVIAPNVECPSLSPDGRRIAFKRRVDPAPQGRVVWRIVVREIDSGRETVLDRETRSVDDQVEWLDDRTIAYALPEPEVPATTNVWALSIDAQTPPRLVMPLAYSPAVVR